MYTWILFDEKMVNNGNKGYLLTTKFYKRKTDDAILALKNRKLEGKEAVHPEGLLSKNQEEMKTKQMTKWKIHSNELHAKLNHPGEYRMLETTTHLHYIIKGVLEVCE